MFCYYFFFSSRRRHTRCYRDWSSDVCSSDLDVVEIQQIATGIAASLVPDAATLNRIRRRRVGGGPRTSAVVGERHVQMPHAEKRSEERRVGKECRKRRATKTQKKKTDSTNKE